MAPIRKKKKQCLFADVLLESDSEEVWFFSESGSEDTEQHIFSESSDYDDNSVSTCRQWTPIDVKNPPSPPPRFVFTATPGIKVPMTEDENCVQYYYRKSGNLCCAVQ
ncbi:hypothetical protein HPB49_012833 [Dermacentor silvarum]|uniref:Uncharacterized protein n=1 Tax=Dermacentor silvarum TaxID=543639 RepID=A0ACB8CRH7_DERSI|nr:hypothetical protein HPB49_012833 [Dermacentor silvarum]